MVDKNDEVQTRMGHYAGFVTRLAARIIDLIVVAIITTLVGVMANVIITFLSIENERYLTIMGVIVIVVNFIIFLTYYIGSWMLAGQTVGKSLMGLRIVTENGERIRLRNAVVRLFGYFISSLFFFLGYLWVLVDDKRRGWHDIMAHTIVVYSESWEERTEMDVSLREHRRRLREARLNKYYQNQ